MKNMENLKLYDLYKNKMISHKVLFEFEYQMGEVYIRDLLQLQEDYLKKFKYSDQVINLMHNLDFKFDFEKEKGISKITYKLKNKNKNVEKNKIL